MALTQELDSGKNNQGALTFVAAAVDMLMPDGVTTAKVQPVALGKIFDDGNGGYQLSGFGGGGEALNVLDSEVAGRVDNVKNAVNQLKTSVTNAENTVTQLTYNTRRNVSSAHAVVLSNTTDTPLVAAPMDGSALDLSLIVVANCDTVDAIVDFKLAGNYQFPISVKAGDTVVVPEWVYGAYDVDWTVQLRASPATGTVEVTAMSKLS